MIRTTLSIASTAPLALAAAWYFGGAIGLGVVLGFLVGAGVSASGVAWTRHVARTRPERALHAPLFTFGVKLVIVLIAVGAMKLLPETSARMDWRAFLLSFATISVVVLLVGTPDATRVLRQNGGAA